MLAGNQLWQVFALLRLVAITAQLIDAEIGMRAVGQADGGGGARNFLHGAAMLEIAKARAAIFLFDGNAVQTELAELRPQVARKLVRLVDFGGARRDLMRREVAHGFADRIRRLAEI